jgi:sugar lactone lactonase YvrE
MIRHHEAELVVDARAEVGEGPRWDARVGRLLWVDIHGAAVHLFDPATGRDESHPVGAPVGAVALRSAGDYVVALPGHLAHWRPGQPPQTLLTVPGEADGRRFNDAACDPAGRLLAGTMSTDGDAAGQGRLYSLTGAGASLLRDGIGLPNGVDWSPDGRTLYFTDSLTAEVSAFAYDPESGVIGVQTGALPISEGLPDGHTVDADGNVWVACWSAGRVLCLTPEGRTIATVTVPVGAVTSCGFGGADLSVLYITTMQQPREDGSLEPLAGGLFACSVDAVGVAPHAFAG